MEAVIGARYKHFKGGIYKVINIATCSETQEEYVVYKSEETNKVWIRPYKMFCQKVDKEKHPEVEQEYRFEYIGK